MRRCVLFRQAMTLIEVVVGIALLVTLMIFVMESSRGVLQKSRWMHFRMEAIDELDRLMLELDRSTLVLDGRTQGIFKDADHMGWRIVAIPDSEDQVLAIRKVKVEVFLVRSPDDKLTSLELAVPASIPFQVSKL